jgi:hypothetical protein
MKTFSTYCWSGKLMIGLALTGLLLCVNARAQITLQDGSVTTTNTTANSTTVSLNNFSVSPGASVLVVSLYDRNNKSGNVSPSSLTWTAPGYGSQPVTRIASAEYLTSTYADSDIYYLYNPNPGTATLTATDTSGNTPSYMTMQAYTLSGVDTSVATPPNFSISPGSVSSVTATLSSGTPAGAWAVVNSSWASLNTGSTFSYSASSGTGSFIQIQNGPSQYMGYVTNLAAGSSTITTSENGGASKMTLAVAVFSPLTIPEPSSLVLFGFGAVAFGLVSRFRRNIS